MTDIPKEVVEFYNNNNFSSRENFGKLHWWLNGNSHIPGLCWGCHVLVEPMESAGYPELVREFMIVTGQKKTNAQPKET